MKVNISNLQVTTYQMLILNKTILKNILNVAKNI